MPIEQPIPEGPRVELGALTEEQLCTPGALKVIYGQLSEEKAAVRASHTELQAEKQKNELLVSRAHIAETNSRVLEERLRIMGRRDTVARIMEFVITVLLAYAIDFAKDGRWGNLVVFVVLAVALAIAIFFVDRGTPSQRES